VSINADHSVTAYERTYLTDEHLAYIAAVYSNALDEGRFPVKAVASALGVSASTAHKRVHTARQRGYLPPTTPGVARAAFRVNGQREES
jgi:transposase